MTIVSYLSRYLLAAVFAIELGYKLTDWGGWIGQFTSLLPFGLPWNLASIAAIGFAVVEGLIVISLVIGKEKFITGWVAIALLLGIMVSLQRVTIGAGAYQSVAAVVRGFLQDQHTWMILAAGLVVTEGWREMEKRHFR